MQYASEHGDIQSFTTRLLTTLLSFFSFFLRSPFLLSFLLFFFKVAHHGTTRGVTVKQECASDRR